MEYNRQRNLAQDEQLATINSQLSILIQQVPSGYLPRVYYGLTRGDKKYRFVANNVINITVEGNVGDSFEFYSNAETEEYIPAIAVKVNSTQLMIAIPGDYNVNASMFKIVNMRTGNAVTQEISNMLTLQNASFLGFYPASTNKAKQITVLYDLASGERNVTYASIDYNNDGTYNWVSIAHSIDGEDGRKHLADVIVSSVQ